MQLLYQKIHVRRLSDLKKAIDSGKVRQLAGFGDKMVEKIKTGIQHVLEYTKRIKLAEAFPIADNLVRYLKKINRSRRLILQAVSDVVKKRSVI